MISQRVEYKRILTEADFIKSLSGLQRATYMVLKQKAREDEEKIYKEIIKDLTDDELRETEQYEKRIAELESLLRKAKLQIRNDMLVQTIAEALEKEVDE